MNLFTYAGQHHRIGGHTILSVLASVLPDGGEIRLEFAGAPAVILRDVHDRSQLEVGSVATPIA